MVGARASTCWKRFFKSGADAAPVVLTYCRIKLVRRMIWCGADVETAIRYFEDAMRCDAIQSGYGEPAHRDSDSGRGLAKRGARALGPRGGAQLTLKGFQKAGAIGFCEAFATALAKGISRA